MNRSVAVGLLFLLAVMFVAAIIPAQSPAGYGDFQAYWSASYLLSQGQDFTDSALLLQVEQEQTGWTRDYPMVTWNPPWLLALLMPYTLVSFHQATWMWFFSNIILIFTSSVLVWLAIAGPSKWRQRSWIAPLIAFAFAPTLVAILAGQVNTLVYFGLALYLYFSMRDRPLAAGLGLALTLVKPHLVYVTLPVILLRSVKKRDWKVWLGLGGIIFALTMVAFILRPSFILDYGRSALAGDLLNWETPTLGGFLAVTLGWESSKLMGLIVLPLMLLLFWKWQDQHDEMFWLNATLLISVITAPFGWGYDVIILLLPILFLVRWSVDERYGRVETILYAASLVLVNGAAFFQRLQGTNEVYFFWLPLMIALIYLLGYARLRNRPSIVIKS